MDYILDVSTTKLVSLDVWDERGEKFRRTKVFGISRCLVINIHEER